ncbi:unnamed protein product [Kuraishia capsulata CBS 1993]|uniref:Large ribosomal subunit protein uL23m n=1 Tax=Kuraishia capsulata CBS 1993 TaxID=1382522 RepID=W6MXP1_9ASCO|nr:uncharacterized protein KUCA_T00005218001 [Kuraishia capsulata CBS 1993]CDK29230.1 unnamed protein product [Kuraishia capsulata CBS 1993]
MSALKQQVRFMASLIRDKLPTPKPKSAVRADISKKIYLNSKEAIENEKPHFRVGGRNLFFPSARVVLLRNNARLTPYQAKFIVPKSFNKLDLRDYLFHIYGLRALNITTQIQPQTMTRALPLPYSTRRRSPLVKKMTIDMEQPFVWPEETAFFQRQEKMAKEMQQYADESNRLRSDAAKPSKAFEGVVSPNPTPTNFVPKRVQRQMKNKLAAALDGYKRKQLEELLVKNVQL